MITKSEINAEKLKLNTPTKGEVHKSVFFSSVLAPTNSERMLQFTLENLGRLPKEFDGHLFLPLLDHPNPKIRCLAVKNIGKLKDESLLEAVSAFARAEKNTFARREAVSAIGRLRTEKAIPNLVQFLSDTDPKVILQAVRGLNCFNERPDVQESLAPLREHPNELVRELLNRSGKGSLSPSAAAAGHQCHPTSPDALKNVIVSADVQEVLKVVPNESVHLTFTSPPYYNARDYTLFQSYEAYLDFLTAIFKETHRITKEGRFFVLNTSPVIVPRISRAHASKRYAIPYDIHPHLTEIGWEFVDDIVWVKPDYAAKNRNGGFFQHRKPLGYKPNCVTESVMVYRKKTDKLIDWNLRQYDKKTVETSRVFGDYEKTNVWQINPAADKVHPAIFPIELASRVIRFYSFKGDLVFDPFGGSGTVGEAAIAYERFFLLCEKEEEYINRSMQRSDMSLFSLIHPPQNLSLQELKVKFEE